MVYIFFFKFSFFFFLFNKYILYVEKKTYPSHWKNAIRYSGISHCSQIGKSIAIIKNGSQQAIKLPVMKKYDYKNDLIY